jgi:DNA polymerase III sliding clamp (beta) subunit (PCNA family)
MEFTVNKTDLVRELSLSQGVVEKKTTIPILSNVLLEAAGDRVILTATDLELGIRCSCPARVKKEGSGTVPARKLLDYVRLLPDADVNMKFLENHWANITCGRSRTRIAGMSRESFPELPEIPDRIAEIPVRTLASMITRTAFGGVTVHAQWRVAGDASRGIDHGGHRWPPPGVRPGRPGRNRAGGEALPGSGTEKGDGRVDQTGG